jgi:hypothetical protein
MNRAVGAVRLVNGGSVGIPLDGDPRPAYALIDFEGDACHVAIPRVTYDHEAVIEAMERMGHPGRSWIGGMIRNARS